MAERVRPLPPKRAFGRWRDDETAALIEASAPLYRRRRDGEIDAWVPLPQHRVVRRSRNLVAEDWRAVAVAVNARRAAAGLASHRTRTQCKSRMDSLSTMYCRELAAGAGSSGWRFFALLHDPEPEDGRSADEAETEGAGLKAEQPRQEQPPPQQQPEVEKEEEEGTRGAAAAAPDGAPRRAPVAAMWGGAKRPRSAVPAPGHAAAATHARPAAYADGFRAAVAELFAGGALGVAAAPRSEGSAAAVSAAAEVAMRLADMCQAVLIKSVDVERDAPAAARHGCRR
ncbi:hypothetical protein ACP4OV_021813 [Aristida adscensionis]